jgi:hypothetical protein
MNLSIRSHRRGLAMLEFVMVLPLLLFIMALIVGFGAASAWKVRENGIARLAVWETRWPRSGTTNPRPNYWPASATMESSDQGSVAALDNSEVDLPVARGPLPPATVNSELLDPTTGWREGDAELTHKFPMGRSLRTFTIAANTWLIDNKWQYQRMGMSSNWERRIPVIYILPEASASLVSSYVQSVMAIIQAPFHKQLLPLDADPDFIYYGALFGWGGAPDFQPRFHSMCTTDRNLTDAAVQRLIDSIQGKHTKREHIPSVEEVMRGAFLGLYERALGVFQAILKETKPPAPPDWRALARAQIPILESYIQELKGTH